MPHRSYIYHFFRNRSSYPFEVQIFAVIQFYTMVLSLISMVVLLNFSFYNYTWPLWFVIAIASFVLLELSIHRKSIGILSKICLSLYCFLLLPWGLFYSGSITSPSCLFAFLVLVQVLFLSKGRQRHFFYFSSLSVVLLFIAVEAFFPWLLLYADQEQDPHLFLWAAIFIAIALVFLREFSSLASILDRYRSLVEDQKDQLYHLSIRDALTGLFNKGYLQSVMDEAFCRARRSGDPLSVILIDIDYFKRYNDRYGHLAGDDCLQQLANIIEDSLGRKTDKAFRFGGEEFVILLEQTDCSGARTLAERLAAALRDARIVHDDSPLQGGYLTLSMGIACGIIGSDDEPRELIARADKALYRAKAEGRDRIELS